MVLRSLALIVLVLGVGGALGGVLMALREDLPRRELSNLPLLVESKVVQKTDVIERFLGYGSAVAVHRANLASEVASTVVERVDQIRAGSPVVKDQVLIRFDDRQYRHALERTSALVEAEPSVPHL